MRRLLLALALALAAACQRDEPMAGGKPLSHWRKEATKVSFMSFWNSDKDQRRHEAFQRLSEIGEPAVPALMDLFQKKSLPVSGDAFNALANLGPRAASAVPALIEMLKGDNNQLRGRAAWVLGTIGGAAEPAVPSLTRLLRHPDQKLRQAAVQALGQIGGSGADALTRAQSSDDPRLREASMRGMAASPLDPAARREHIATGLADASPQVRLRAIDLLMTAGREEAQGLAEYLVKALNDPDTQVNQAAHAVLTVYLQQGQASPPLLATVLKGGDVEARADAAWHLGNRMGDVVQLDNARRDATVLDALLGALDDSERKIRIYAARALASSEGSTREQGLRALRREMPSADPIIAVRAARVLWAAERNAAVVRPVYEAGLRDANEWNRVETISAILDMGREGDVFATELERLRSDPSGAVRDRVQKALYAINRRRGQVELERSSK